MAHKHGTKIHAGQLTLYASPTRTYLTDKLDDTMSPCQLADRVSVCVFSIVPTYRTSPPCQLSAAATEIVALRTSKLTNARTSSGDISWFARPGPGQSAAHGVPRPCHLADDCCRDRIALAGPAVQPGNRLGDAAISNRRPGAAATRSAASSQLIETGYSIAIGHIRRSR